MRATRCDRSRTTRSRMWCAAVRSPHTRSGRTRALLTLGTVLVPGGAGAALAVCDQILAIEAFPEVESIHVRLLRLVGTEGSVGA